MNNTWLDRDQDTGSQFVRRVLGNVDKLSASRNALHRDGLIRFVSFKDRIPPQCYLNYFPAGSVEQGPYFGIFSVAYFCLQLQFVHKVIFARIRTQILPMARNQLS